MNRHIKFKRKKDLDILNKLRASFKEVPTKPLTDGKFGVIRGTIVISYKHKNKR